MWGRTHGRTDPPATWRFSLPSVLHWPRLWRRLRGCACNRPHETGATRHPQGHRIECRLHL